MDHPRPTRDVEARGVVETGRIGHRNGLQRATPDEDQKGFPGVGVDEVADEMTLIATLRFASGQGRVVAMYEYIGAALVLDSRRRAQMIGMGVGEDDGRNVVDRPSQR